MRDSTRALLLTAEPARVAFLRRRRLPGKSIDRIAARALGAYIFRAGFGTGRVRFRVFSATIRSGSRNGSGLVACVGLKIALVHRSLHAKLNRFFVVDEGQRSGLLRSAQRRALLPAARVPLKTARSRRCICRRLPC